MAVSPLDILQTKDLNVEKVKSLEQSIDNLLSDAVTRSQSVTFTSKGEAFQVNLKTTLSDAEKQMLKSLYLTAGWREVEIFTDLECGTSAHLTTFLNLYI